MKVTRVVAFDPGYERLGIAVLERSAGTRDILMRSECFRTDKKLPFPERLRRIGEAVETIIQMYKPDAAATENIYFEKNAKTAIKIAEVRGVLTYIAATHKLSIHEYTPLQIKIAVTGYGKSDKHAVASLVARLIEIPSRPSPKTNKRLDDEMDAIAIGITCLASSR